MSNNIELIQPFVIKGLELKAQVTDIVIDNNDQKHQGDMLLRQINEVEKSIESTRDWLVRPHNELVKSINLKVKEIALPVIEAKELIKKKLIEYALIIEKQKQLENDRTNAIIDELKQCNSEDNLRSFYSNIDEKDQENPLIQSAFMVCLWNLTKDLEAIEEAETFTKTAEILEKRQDQTDKVKWLQTITKFEIIDEDLIPRQACSPDEKKIRAMIKSWVDNIPWVRIYQEKTVR